MVRDRMMKRTSVIVLASALLGLVMGCPTAFAPVPGSGDGSTTDNGGGPPDGNVVEPPTHDSGDPSTVESGEPNGSFNVAMEAVFDAAGTARLQGTVSTAGDLDVFKLGPMSAGDRIVVDAYAFNSSLDVTIALFDAQEKLVFNNDDRADFAGASLDALIDLIVRHGGAEYYLVVSNSPFGSSQRLTGGYRVDIEVSGGAGVPPPVGQTILLDFDGAVVDSPVLGTMTLNPFDAADVAAIYAGQTQTIIDQIVRVFKQNYERFDVTVLTSADPPPAPGTLYSTLFMGGFDPMLFGIAENVDLYDIDRCDDALIFLESFSPAVFSVTPTALELGTAMGNVAAHEAGHLLGLNHTDDDLDLMDDQSPADAFIADQEFKTAPLSGDIVPIGFQDGVLLLDEIVGPR